jgi:hypothetical protein
MTSLTETFGTKSPFWIRLPVEAGGGDAVDTGEFAAVAPYSEEVSTPSGEEI